MSHALFFYFKKVVFFELFSGQVCNRYIPDKYKVMNKTEQYKAWGYLLRLGFAYEKIGIPNPCFELSLTEEGYRWYNAGKVSYKMLT